MKRITTFCALALLALGALTACNEQSVHLDPAANIFDGANVYFESGSTENLSAKIALDGSISEVACGRTKAASGEYSYSDGVLTLAGNFIKAITGSGEKTVTVTTSSGKKALNALVCTKVISTADQFQAINTDAASLAGTYVLANDIDLTSIDNFEPLGWYVSEQDPNNAYFHGILEGNGHTIKNGKVYYSDSVASNYNVYSESGTRFSHAGHINGDNIGLFQVIGSSGIVRNVNFSNIKVRGRTIVGVIAGNVMGTVQNCFVDASCSVEMGTHFYDDDCNMGGCFGIVAGSGNVSNVISRVTNLTIGSTGSASFGGVAIEKGGIYLDFDDVYKGKTGNGWDHGDNNPDINWWKYCGVDRDYATTTGLSGKAIDSNGSQSNGEYAFVGKCWGTVSSCVAQTFKITPMDGSARTVNFGQTHIGINKPTSGASDMGTLTNNQLLSLEDMKLAAKYSAFDGTVWKIADGALPTLLNQYNFVAKVQA